MKKKIGVKLKNENRTPVFLTGMLTIILIVTFAYTLKNYEPVKNVIITGGILSYPLTFLITALISKYYGFKETRKAIYISSGLYALFFLLIMVSAIPHSNYATLGHNYVVQYLFANEFITLSPTYSIYYPNLGQFFGIIVSFFVSHLLFAAIYNAIKDATVDYLSVGLGIFIAYIVDRLIFVPLLFAKGLLNGVNTFDYLIGVITSEFMAAILMTIIMIILYIIIVAIRKQFNKEKISED